MWELGGRAAARRAGAARRGEAGSVRLQRLNFCGTVRVAGRGSGGGGRVEHSVALGVAKGESIPSRGSWRCQRRELRLEIWDLV